MRLEGLSQCRVPVTPSGIKPTTFQLVAQCHNQLLHRVPTLCIVVMLFYSLEEEDARDSCTFDRGAVKIRKLFLVYSQMQSERCCVVIIARVAVPSRSKILLTGVRVQRICGGVASKILQLLTMLSSVTFSRSLLFLLIFHLVVRPNYFHLHCVSLLSVSHPPLFMSIPITSGV